MQVTAGPACISVVHVTYPTGVRTAAHYPNRCHAPPAVDQGSGGQGADDSSGTSPRAADGRLDAALRHQGGITRAVHGPSEGDLGRPTATIIDSNHAGRRQDADQRCTSPEESFNTSATDLAVQSKQGAIEQVRLLSASAGHEPSAKVFARSIDSERDRPWLGRSVATTPKKPQPHYEGTTRAQQPQPSSTATNASKRLLPWSAPYFDSLRR
jgi:hypothetical protein